MNLDSDGILNVGSAALAVLGALTAGVFSVRANRQAHELERKRRIETQQEAAERVIAHYRDPLLDAAQTMQARLYNILNNNYFGKYLHCGDPAEEQYARDYTQFAIGEYLCWAEIVRRELRFLDAGEDRANRRLLGLLDKVQGTLQSDQIRSPFRLLRGVQRAIAELMMVPTGAAEGPRTECMGFAAFSRRLHSDAEFARWFASLDRDIEIIAQAMAAGDKPAIVRLPRLQNDLVRMIEHLDPHHLRITMNRTLDPDGADEAPVVEIPEQKPRRRARRAARAGK